MYSDKFQMNALIILKGEKEREERGENQGRIEGERDRDRKEEEGEKEKCSDRGRKKIFKVFWEYSTLQYSLSL